MNINLMDLLDPCLYKEYLKKMALFPHHSSFNIALILEQNPNATLLAGFNVWKKDHGRVVVKGEKGIKIYLPAMVNQEGSEYKKLDYKLVSVFDIEQTKGSEFIGNNKVEVSPEELIKILRKNIDYGIYLDNETSNTENSIIINKDLNIGDQLRDIFREYIKLEYKYEIKEKEMKLVSDSISYVICSNYGIAADIDFDYIKDYKKEHINNIDRIFRTIQNKVSELIDAIDSFIKKDDYRMRFTFNETQLINVLMWEPDKYKLTKRLINYDINIDDKELKMSLHSLSRKIKKLSEEDIETLYNDRISYKTKTFPQYKLK